MVSKRSGFAAIALIAVLILTAFICGCTGSETAEEKQTISVTGSTTVLPIAQQAAEDYMIANPNTEISVSSGGSSVGIQAVGEGTADIGMASRELKSSEKELYPELVRYVIASDGIAIIVNPANSVGTLTVEQVREIYAGNITQWSEVGGNQGEIVVVGRDSASGTRTSFEDLVMDGEEVTMMMHELNSNGMVQSEVAGTPGAVGYVGLGYIDETVKALRIEKNGVATAPTIGTVLDGSYPISRTLNMFTNGEATGLAKDFIDFILSPEGQAIVEEEMFVPIR